MRRRRLHTCLERSRPMAKEVSVGAVTAQPARWWLICLLGLISIAAGVLAIAYPDLTLLALGLFFGITLMLIGATWIVVGAEESASTGTQVLRIMVGILATLAGMVCLVRPGAGVLALLVAVSFWFIVTGISDIARAVAEPEGRVFSAIIGLVGIAVGVVLVADPDIGLETLALIAGIGFLVRGTIELAVGIYLRTQS
jgi:uncharacterized membrane protein HdeD (DUF308 family)